MKDAAKWITAAIEILCVLFQEVLAQYIRDIGVRTYLINFVNIICVVAFISFLLLLIFKFITFFRKGYLITSKEILNLIIFFVFLIISGGYILRRFPTETKTLQTDSTATPTMKNSLASKANQIKTQKDDWDFKNGCIPDEWIYWPISSALFINNNEEEYKDYSSFGFDAESGKGLYIAYAKPDRDIIFGISRQVPEDLTQFIYRIEWTSFYAGDSNTTFIIGLVDTDSIPITGQFFTLQRKQGSEEPLYLYVSCPNVSDPVCDYIGYFNEWGGERNSDKLFSCVYQQDKL